MAADYAVLITTPSGSHMLDAVDNFQVTGQNEMTSHPMVTGDVVGEFCLKVLQVLLLLQELLLLLLCTLAAHESAVAQFILKISHLALQGTGFRVEFQAGVFLLRHQFVAGFNSEGVVGQDRVEVEVCHRHIPLGYRSRLGVGLLPARGLHRKENDKQRNHSGCKNCVNGNLNFVHDDILNNRSDRRLHTDNSNIQRFFF